MCSSLSEVNAQHKENLFQEVFLTLMVMSYVPRHAVEIELTRMQSPPDSKFLYLSSLFQLMHARAHISAQIFHDKSNDVVPGFFLFFFCAICDRVCVRRNGVIVMFAYNTWRMLGMSDR